MRVRIGLICILGSLALLPGGCDRDRLTTTNAIAPADHVELLPNNGPNPFLASVGSSTLNFGTMGQETSDRHIFQITNEGEGELKIRLANTSCGCTSVKFGEVEWNPKDEPTAPRTVVRVPVQGKLDIELTWDTQMKSGEFRTSATFETNDPRQPMPQFTVEGQIQPFIEVSDTLLQFVGTRNTEPTSAFFYLYSKILDDLEITEVVSSNPLVTTQVEPASQEMLEGLLAKRGYKCTATVQPGVPIGRFDAKLVVYTNHEKRKEVEIGISGSFTGDVMVSPDRLSFGHVAAGKSSALSTIVKVRSESDVNVSVKRVVPDFLVVELKQSGSAKNRYQLQVVIPADAPGGEFRGGVELTTDHPTASSVKIPIHGIIAVPAAGRPSVASP